MKYQIRVVFVLMIIMLAIVGCTGMQEVVSLFGDNLQPEPRAVLPSSIYDYSALPQGKTAEGAPTLGQDDAPVVMEIFSSFSCSPCATYFSNVYTPLRDLSFIQEGKLRVIFYPLAAFGSFNSTNMASAALCANEQGKFWEMQTVMFDWQRRYGKDSENVSLLTSGAEKLGLDRKKFEACMASSYPTVWLSAIASLGNTRNINATPSVFVNGEMVYPEPRLEFDALQEKIEALLEK